MGVGSPRVRRAFSITDVSDLELWLAFNTGQGAITDGIQWNDQSGNNRHASQTVNAQEGSFSGGAYVTNADSKANVSSVDSTSFIRFAQSGTATSYRMKNGGTTCDITLSSGFGTTKAIAEISRNSSNTVTVKKNGSSLGTSTGTGTFAFQQIGTTNSAVTSGEIHEVVAFSKELSSSEATNVRNDIASRCSISI